MRWGSSVVPVRLVSFSLQPHTFCPVLSSFSCLHPFVFAACTFTQGCEYISGFFRFFLEFFVFRVSWQVQYFVGLAKHISWQAQDFVGLAGAGLFVGLEVQISWQVSYFVALGVQILWQAQDFVDLEVQISWQMQDFVGVEV